MKIIFMGTPDFSVPTLEALLQASHEVVAVVTQPDKVNGRGNKIIFSPVKDAALKHNIEVLQPIKIREQQWIDKLSSYNADAIIVVAFGQILPKAILEMTRYGCINVHASLLPKYRGAAPIQWAVVNGETESGVTIMYMDIGIDTGDIISSAKLDLTAEETGESLHDKLMVLGAELLINTLTDIEKGITHRVKQNEEQSTYVSIFKKEDGCIDWNKPAEEIERLVRGLYPWPSAYTKIVSKVLKIYNSRVLHCNYSVESGTIVKATKDSVVVQTGKDCLELLEVQLEGKKRMDIASFLRGYTMEANTKLERG